MQLTNFWQDVSVDLAKNHIIFRKIFGKAPYFRRSTVCWRLNPAFRDCILALVRETRKLFNTGKPLLSSVDFRLRKEVATHR
ncbi:MAG: squalene/phytoene synthase family protein [Calditrichia bacterium]